MPTPEECIRRFNKTDLDPESHEYLRFHARRFSYLVALVAEAAAKVGPECRILDVGPAYQTALIRDALPHATVNSFGFYDGRFPLRTGEQHFTLDLNETQFPDRCPPASEQHDIIVMAEVIEHLYTAPQLVLAYLAGWLKPGALLLLQTPNAVALGKRLAVLRGTNPFDMIRDQRSNPGHFREYTLDELRDVGSRAGLSVERYECKSYFGVRTLKSRIYVALCALGPGLLDDGLTIWYRRVAAPDS